MSNDLNKLNLFEIPITNVESRISHLTDGQREVLSLMLEGKSIAEIANLLGIGRGGLDLRIKNACQQAGVNTQFQLIALYVIYQLAQKTTQKATQEQPEVMPRFTAIDPMVPLEALQKNVNQHFDNFLKNVERIHLVSRSYQTVNQDEANAGQIYVWTGVENVRGCIIQITRRGVVVTEDAKIEIHGNHLQVSNGDSDFRLAAADRITWIAW